MKEHKKEHTIKKMAEVFGVSCSAYYKWVRNGVSTRRKEEDAVLIDLIRKIVEANYYRYGSPRVRRDLRNLYGKRVSLKKVARLMRENKLNVRPKRKFIHTTDSNHSNTVYGNILNREFYAGKGGMKWVSDITYLRTNGDWVFLTVILDLYDRKIIGWALSADMETAHTSVIALEMAVKNRKAQDGLIFHSDRGIQYCAQGFCNILRQRCPTARQSMSRKGNCWDNACAESFFKTLKRELETLDGRHSEAEVRQSVFMYIEAYYNRVRLHSALDYAAPNEYNSSKVA